MKALYLTTALIATLSFGAQAQDVDYDQKNTAALESNVGFVGLEVGEQITQDNGIRARANQALQNEVNYATQDAPMQNNMGANAGVRFEATIAPAQMQLKKSIDPMPAEDATGAPSATLDMDVKNESNLQNQTGFVGLEVGEQITQDNEQMSGKVQVQSQTQTQTITDMNPTQVEVTQPTMPIIVEKGNSVIVEETKVIGNTDTGVSVETMMKAKQKAGIGLTQ